MNLPRPAAILWMLGVVALPAAEPVILVTAFQPFAGRGVNGSATLVRALERQGVPGHHLESLVLPVTWGGPERLVPAAVERLRPVLLLGLGEGHPGRLACERVARNHAEGRDERGQPPPAALLLTMGPWERRSTLAFDASWSAHLARPMTASDDAGGYLCNNLFYVALGLPVARTGFVHVPPQGEASDATYAAEHLPAITILITRALMEPAPRR